MEVNESENEYEYFARCSDSHFWADKGRVKTLIELYRKHECLCNVKRSDYKKSTTKKKTAKEEIGKHFGMTGMVDVSGVTSSHRPDNVFKSLGYRRMFCLQLEIFDSRYANSTVYPFSLLARLQALYRCFVITYSCVDMPLKTTHSVTINYG